MDVDPERLHRHSELFAGNGYAVEHTTDGRIGLALAPTTLKRGGTIVVAEMADGLDGITMCRLLMTERANQPLRVVLLAGTRASELDDLRTAGIHVIPIPASGDELVAAVSRPATLSPRPPPPEATRAIGQIVRRRRAARSRMERVLVPPLAPRTLYCKTCGRVLVHLYSLLGGIHADEQWDLFECTQGCARYRYRHRTRVLAVLNPNDR